MATPTKIGLEFRVNSSAANGQYTPSVVGIGNGTVVVTYADTSYEAGFGGLHTGVTGQVLNADGSWYAASWGVLAPPVSPFIVNTWSNPGVASIGSAGYAIGGTWSYEGVQGISLSTVFYTNPTHDPLATISYGPNIGFNYQALAGFGGNMLAFVHQAFDTDSVGIFLQLYDASGGALGGAAIVNTAVVGTQARPDVAGLSFGGFVVVWDDFGAGGATHALRYQFYDQSGAALGGNFTANAVTHGIVQNWDRDAVAGLAGGGFVITHNDYNTAYGDNSGSGIVAEIVNGAGAVINTFQVNTTVAGDQNRPDVVGLADGRFFVVWTDGSGTEGAGSSGTAIRGQMFLANGTKDGAEILINMFTFGDQISPSVTQVIDGRLLVTWQTASGVLDSAETGISGQFLETRSSYVYWVDTSSGGTQYVGTQFNDFLFGYQGQDSIWGGEGIDLILGGDGADKLYGQDGGDNLQGGNEGDYLLGNAGHDFLFGEWGDDILYGDATVIEAGIDTLVGGVGNDTLFGMSGSDVLYGDEFLNPPFHGADILLGGDGVDWLFGQGGDDVLYGEAGQDFIYGGPGTDYIYTGTGNDYVYFEQNAGTDILGDWTSGQDTIVFQGVPGVSSMSSLTIADGGDYVAISYAGNLLYVLGATASQFGGNDIIFA